MTVDEKNRRTDAALVFSDGIGLTEPYEGDVVLCEERPIDEVWEEARSYLKKRLKTPTYESWVRPMKLKSLTPTEAVVAVVNDFAKDRLTGLHFEEIRKSVCLASGYDLTLKIVVDESIQSTPTDYVPSIGAIAVGQQSPNSESATTSGAQGSAGRSAGSSSASFDTIVRAQASNLNPKHTIDTFVVGSHNRFCYSAATAVAERPGQTYNPLFIYGGVGLGKTHIMHAIGHQVMKTNPRMTVRYITCERFTNDLINSIRENKMIEFRKRYRQVDVLLVDDIHFIEGKESTQEEFFHTFNALRESGRQIVLSSDRPPKEIPKLEERLRSRFEWGLIADMQPPDFETRLAILRSKCESERIQVEDSVLQYIATQVTSNIRELEGALCRAQAYGNLSGSPLNLQTAASVLQVGSPVSSKTTLTVENIIGAVAEHYKVDTSDLRSQKRSQDLASPRHIAMYLVHDHLKISHSRIGEYFGGRKHSSVIYAIDKVKLELVENVALSHSIAQIRRRLSD
ncbi:MAG TPA: chromosomal replication initiator protein DnaA [Candidatus Obscuribacterales bacterium]